MLNEIFHTYKKIIVLVVLMGSAVIFWFFGCHRNQNTNPNSEKWERKIYEDGGYEYEFSSDNLKGTVVFGLKGYMVKDKNVPVRVTMESGKDEFIGLIRILIPGDGGSGIAYQAGIQCQNKEVTEKSLLVPQLGNASYFVFEILDQYGNTILSETEIPVYSEWNYQDEDISQQICMGVFSDNMEQLNFLDQLHISVQDETVRIRTIALDENSFPDDIDSLRMVSAIYIDCFDTSKFNEKQKNLLYRWTQEGGRLIIATGKYGGKDLRGLGEDFGVQTGNVEMERLYFQDSADFSGEISLYLNQLTFDDNAGWTMVNWSQPASFYEKKYGSGLIQVLRFSNTDESLLQWSRLNEMTQSLMKKLLGSIFERNVDEENGLWNMENALNGFIQSQIPNAFFYGLFFIFYLSCLTFIAYYLLRKVNRREFIWIIVPVMALIFTSIIVLRTKGYSSNPQNRQNSLSCIRIVDDASTKNNIYLLYQNAEGEGKNLSFIPAIEQVKPLDYVYGQEILDHSRLRKINGDYVISHTVDGEQVAFAETTPGTTRMLEMTENKTVNYGEKTQIFVGKFDGDHTAFSGTITNQSDKDFDKILAIRGSQYWIHDNLKAGSSVQVSKEDVKYLSSDETEIIDFSEDSNMVEEYLIQYIANRYAKNNSNLSDVILVGIDLEDRYQLLRGGERLGNQVSVYVNHIQIALPEKAEYCANINKGYLCNNKTEEELMTEIQEKNRAEAKYLFDSNKVVWAMARNRDSFSGKIYAYNYSTEKMEVILSKKDTVMQYEDLKPYLSEDNEMKLAYECQSDETDITIPMISVWQKKMVR